MDNFVQTGVHLRKYPVTGTQRNMLLLSVSNPGQGFNIEQLICRTKEVIIPEIFRSAWQELVYEFPELATCFLHDSNWNWTQHLNQSFVLDFNWHDWNHIPIDNTEKEFNEWIENDRFSGFEVSEPVGMMRINAFRFSDQTYGWVWTVHHALSDGRSLLNYINKLIEILKNPNKHFEIIQKTESCSFFEAVQAIINQNDFNQTYSKEFWSSWFGGLLLQGGRKTDITSSSREQIHRLIGIEETALLKKFCRSLGITIHILIEAALALTWSWIEGSSGVCFGSVRSGRRNLPSHMRNCTGMLIYTQPVPFRIKDGGSVREWLLSLRQFRKEARNFEHADLSQVHSCAGQSSGEPLFNIVLAAEDYDLGEELNRRFGEGGKHTFQLLEKSELPLVINIGAESSLSLKFIFAPDVWNRNEIENIWNRFRIALEKLTSCIDSPVDAISLLNRQEQAELKKNLHGAEVEFPRNRRMHQWFDISAEKFPKKTAIISKDATWTYKELQKYSYFIERSLASLITGEEQIVGVWLPRSAMLLGAMLGISRCGAVYLPLATNQPIERIRDLLHLAKPAAVITLKENEGILESEWNTILLGKISPEELICQESKKADCASSGGKLAYTMFTSGSSGSPKLVAVENEQLNNLIHYFSETLIQPEYLDFVPFFAGISADSSVIQIMGALAVGGTLVQVMDFNDLLSPDRVKKWTCLGTTPSVLSSLLKLTPLPKSMRFLGLGAEVIPESLVRIVTQSPNLERIINYYGPTETTVYSLIDVVWQRGQVNALSNSSGRIIGRPIQNTQIFIKDELGRDRQPGKIGEIVISGSGVARGYLIAAKEDHEMFRHQLCESGKRVKTYRTGDLARVLPDGRVEFLGRKDSQIKINGVRVELGELEHHIQSIPGVHRVVVTVDEEKRIIVFYELLKDSAVSTSEIRLALEKKLPQYMIPNQWFPCKNFPLTHSGKIDLKALFKLRPKFQRSILPPATEMERSLVEIWKRLLKVSEISIEDNFFEIGGDSLIAMQLVVEISVLSTIRVNLSFLYQAPTIQKLAALLEEPEQNIKFQYLSPYRDKGSLPPLFCAPGFNGMSLELKKLAGLLDPELPIIGINATEVSNTNEYLPDFESLIEGFVDEIARYQPKGPIHLIGYSIGGIYAFAMAELLLKRGREIGWLGMIDTSPVPYLPQWIKRFALCRMIIHRAKIEFTKNIPEFWRMSRDKYWISRIYIMLFRIPCNFINLVKVLNSPYNSKKSKIKQTIPKTEDYQNEHFVVITKKYLISTAQLRLTLFSGDSMYNWTSIYWKKFAKRGVELISIPVCHFDFFKHENIQVTADFINNDLKSVNRL